MNINSRRCGCGQVFGLPSLMSRETRCVACSRAQAQEQMRARVNEVAPKAKAGVNVYQADLQAYGYPGADGKQLRTVNHPTPSGLMTSAIASALKETYAVMIDGNGLQRPLKGPEEDRFAVIPPMPATVFELENLIRDGWVVEVVGSPSQGQATYQHEMRPGIGRAVRGNDGEGGWDPWRQFTQKLSQSALTTGYFRIARPQ